MSDFRHYSHSPELALAPAWKTPEYSTGLRMYERMMGLGLRPGGSIIPPLVVPQAAPEVVAEPESASVQMLRKLLADRRRERASDEASRKSITNTAEYYDELATRNRKAASEHADRVAAADEAIASILYDIKVLGGEPEESAD